MTIEPNSPWTAKPPLAFASVVTPASETMPAKPSAPGLSALPVPALVLAPVMTLPVAVPFSSEHVGIIRGQRRVVVHIDRQRARRDVAVGVGHRCN